MLRNDRIYIACEAERDCRALTNCFMYLFLALHLDTISSLSILDKQQPIYLFFLSLATRSRVFMFVFKVFVLSLARQKGKW